MCPPGMEASVYAILTSYQSLGENVARTVGVGLLEFWGVRTTVPCDFSKLPLAILVGHLILPAFTVPLVFLLIPHANMTDNLADTRETPARTSHRQASDLGGHVKGFSSDSVDDRLKGVSEENLEGINLLDESKTRGQSAI